MMPGMLRPDFGGARILGEDSTPLARRPAPRMAYLAETHPLYGHLSIGAMERLTRSFYPHWNQALLERILDHFQLPAAADAPAVERAAGQGVAGPGRGPDPELLILDDPTLGLDTVVRRDFLESMIQIIQRRGRTIFFSSHNLGDVERVADRIGILVDGVLRVDCPTEHFKEAIRKVVLEFRGTPPAFPFETGVLSDCTVGHRRELVIANYTDEHRAAAEATEARSIEVLELPLEDAFVEYTRGPEAVAAGFLERERCTKR